MSSSISSSDSRNMDLLSAVASSATRNGNASKSTTKSTSRKAKQLPLPVVLMKLLNDETIPSAIWWLPGSEEEFAINTELFSSQVLGIHMPPSKYPSFLRRLRKWGFSRQSSKRLKKIYGEQMPPNSVSFRHNQGLFDKKRPELLHTMKNCTATVGMEDTKKKTKAASSSKKSKVLPGMTMAPINKAKIAPPKMVPSTIIAEPAPCISVDNMDDLTASNLLMQFGLHQKLPPSFVSPGSEQAHGHHEIDMASLSLLVQQEQLRQFQLEEEQKRQQENEQRVYNYLLQQELEKQRQAMMLEAMLFEEHQNHLQQQMAGMTHNTQQQQSQDDLLLIQLLQQQQQQQQQHGNLGYPNALNMGHFF